MKMYGVFAIVPAPSGDAGDLSKNEYAAKLAESDKNPVALCRYGDEAQDIVKKRENGVFEVREVDVTAFEVITRRPVTL